MTDRPTRPRIEGAREREIYVAAVDMVGELGYDRVTIDEVAARASASKASLYRRWGDKAALISAAICAQPEDELRVPDTGSVSRAVITGRNTCGWPSIRRITGRTKSSKLTNALAGLPGSVKIGTFSGPR